MANENTEKTEREKYVEDLQGKIAKAVTAKRFNESDEGKLIRTWASEQINAVVRELGGKKFLNDHNAYVYATGELAMARKLLAMLDYESSKDIGELTASLKAAKTDG